jgi:hypothetical protein
MKDTDIPVGVLNQRLIESLSRGETKIAQEGTTDVTRTGFMEESIAYQVLPPEKGMDSDLVPDLDERLRFIAEKEPEGPPAKWVGLRTVPEGEYMTGSRYWVPVARVRTKRLVKDLDELRTYRKVDLRKVLSKKGLNEGMKAIDAAFFKEARSIAMDSAGPGEAHNETGKIQYETYTDGLTRDTFVEASKMLPRAVGDRDSFALKNYVAVMNDITARDFLKQKPTDIGDKLSETMWQKGLTISEFLGIKTIFTLKRSIVQDNEVFFFAAPEFLGQAKYLQDWTTYVETKEKFVSINSLWLGGFAFGNVAGVCLAKFNQPAES